MANPKKQRRRLRKLRKVLRSPPRREPETPKASGWDDVALVSWAITALAYDWVILYAWYSGWRHFIASLCGFAVVWAAMFAVVKHWREIPPTNELTG